MGQVAEKNRGILKFKIAKKLIQSTWFAKIMGCQIFLTDVLQCVSQKNPTIICSNVRNVVQNVKKWFVAEKKACLGRLLYRMQTPL